MDLVVLGAAAQDDLLFVDPGLGPQMIEAAFLDEPFEITGEPVEIPVAEFVQPDPGAGLPQPDPRVGDDAEVPLATPHGVK